jgi:hypothetical protein
MLAGISPQVKKISSLMLEDLGSDEAYPQKLLTTLA